MEIVLSNINESSYSEADYTEPNCRKWPGVLGLKRGSNSCIPSLGPEVLWSQTIVWWSHQQSVIPLNPKLHKGRKCCFTFPWSRILWVLDKWELLLKGSWAACEGGRQKGGRVILPVSRVRKAFQDEGPAQAKTRRNGLLLHIWSHSAEVWQWKMKWKIRWEHKWRILNATLKIHTLYMGHGATLDHRE